MPKRMVAYAAIFNVLMIVAFTFSNIYMWDYLRTAINEEAGNQGQGNLVIPYIWEMGFQVGIGHEYWSENGTIVNLGPIPTAVPNYPFILFWAAMVGNILFAVLILRRKQTS